MARRRTIVVVGGALSGPVAASRARETDERARIVMLERARDVSYAVAGAAPAVAGEVRSAAALNRERAEFFRDRYDVEVRTGVEVRAIDADARELRLDDGTLAYDALVYAAGAESIVPAALRGLVNVHRFRSVVDVEEILGALGNGARRVSVIGGGFFGVEAATAFRRRGCSVTMIERGPRLLRSFAEPSSRAAEDALRRLGVDVRCGVRVAAARTRGDVARALELSDGAAPKVDLVVVAAGVKPRTRLLAKAGVRLHPDGSVAIDDRAETSKRGVFAAGVCAAVRHAVTGRPYASAQAAVADKTALVAGENAGGGRATLPSFTDTAIVRAGDVVLARTGLTAEAARRTLGPRLVESRARAPAADPCLSRAPDVTLTLRARGSDGRLMGAEAFGGEGVGARIGVLAAAVAGGLTVERLAALDLACAPEFAPARDPINVAGQVARAARRRLAPSLRPWEVASRKRRLHVVDVRDPGARSLGTLTGAASMPFATLRRRIERFPADAPLVFVDDDGRLAYLAARLARQRGYERAAWMAGGLREWVAEGRPLRAVPGGRR